MDTNVIIITIDGQDYYIQADRLPDLHYIGGKLVNTSNSSITLVSSFSTENTYPRITFNAMQQGRLYRTNQQTWQAVTSDYTVKSKFSIYQIGSQGIQSAILFILILILGVRLIWKR